MGEKAIQALTSDYQNVALTFQMAEVSRPLASVGEICDKGNLVVFGPKGGYILNMSGGQRTGFERRGGIYELDLCIKNGDPPQENAGFTRRGRP